MSENNADVWREVNDLRVIVAKLEERIEHDRRASAQIQKVVADLMTTCNEFKSKFANQAGANRVLVFVVSTVTAIVTTVIGSIIGSLL